MKVVVGVDPGVTGALALMVNGLLVDVADMPAAVGAGTKSNRVLAGELRLIVDDWGFRYPEPDHQWMAIVEGVNAMPKNGAIAGFSLGHSLGTVDAVLHCLLIGVEHVSPAVWKRAMGLGKDKNASRALASQLYPGHATKWARVKDDGRAEAVLLAHWFTHRSGRAGAA